MGLDSVELVMAVESEFDINITDGDATQLLTPRQLADHVQILLIRTQRNRPPEEILFRVRLLTARQLGLTIEAIDPDKHFVRDLGLN